MRDYLSSSKFITKPRLRDVFSNSHCLRAVSTYVFFSSLLLWELVTFCIIKTRLGMVVFFALFDVITHNGSYKFMHVSTY